MSDQISIAAIGNVKDKSTFSGIPYHFWATAANMGFAYTPWEMDLSGLATQRNVWNLIRLLQFQFPGGFQYSNSFRKSIMKQIPESLLQTSVISFNQHFPSADVILKNGGKVYYYIDATFTQLLDRYGVSRQIGKRMQAETLANEKENFQKATKIFTFQNWARNSVIQDYGISAEKVQVILPGANIIFDSHYHPKEANCTDIGKTQLLVLGFVGKDWKRKGLLLLADIRDLLEARGWNVLIHCAGYAPADFKKRKGIEFVGFIDKNTNPTGFIKFLESCHIGCLFSEAEFSSISVLEFISTGRPVAGFIVDGMGDLFLPGLSLAHPSTSSRDEIASGFENYLTNANFRDQLNKIALEKSEYARWERAVEDIQRFL